MIPLPLWDENPSPSLRLVLIPLILANVLVFAWEVASPVSMREIVLAWGFLPSHPEPHRWLTSQFLHAGLMHLAGNMWFLWIFGDNVEGRLRQWFLPFYLFCGAGANAFDWIVRAGSGVPAVGASGAISGVLGAYFVLFPTARLECLWMLGFYAQRVSISARVFGAIYVVVQLLMAWLAPGAGVAYAAHLGGAFFGALCALGFTDRPAEAVPLSGPAGVAPADAPRPEPAAALPGPDPRQAVLAYISQVRRDPYFALPPEAQLRMARLLLNGGQAHLSRSALRKLVLRNPRGPLAAEAHLALARLEQDWFRRLPDARRHLEVAQRGSPALGPDLVREIEERIKRVNAVLDKTFAEEPAEGERYWILRESEEPLNDAQERRLAQLLGETPQATATRLASDHGILARDVSRADAALVADNLELAGVPVLVLPQRSVLLLPRPELAESLAAGPEGPSLKLAGGAEFRTGWDRCLLIAAVGLRLEGRQAELVELFTLDPLRRLRWWEPNWSRPRYYDLLQDLLLKAQDVPVNAGALGAFERELPDSCRYPDADSLDRALAWEIQLAYQKREGLYRPAG